MSNTHWHPGKRCCVYPFMKKSIKILVENPVCHKSQCKWPECRNATGVSQVTPPAESIKMVQYSQNHFTTQIITQDGCVWFYDGMSITDLTMEPTLVCVGSINCPSFSVQICRGGTPCAVYIVFNRTVTA